MARDIHAEIDHNFTYHPPKEGYAQVYSDLREQARALAFYIAAMGPPSREQSLAITKLEECVFWANAAFARKV
jgi:hypothetical protein